MRTLLGLLVLSAGVVRAQRAIPPIEGETLSGRKVTLPLAAGGQPALLIIGFTRASQEQTKAWGLRMHDRVPAWSIAVLEDVPRLVRGMVTHSIRSATPKAQHDRFLLVYHGEKELKTAVMFDRSDDAYLLVIDGTGSVRFSFHGPVTDDAAQQVIAQVGR